ncbi:hypothetical protein NOF55_09435 [Rhizobiaceae bacterium BDR2-2]|uniref:Uncharacterized protein n=1 Tax=Ectorhizobium quercum TaxID=2965071 RepID=A0AAE3SUQ2_9HYPH|nr:hypothetical protein [Ectorhizobium quercum]MCX8997327.1 hypothetical protein [Ectorhizobium quercum]
MSLVHDRWNEPAALTNAHPRLSPPSEDAHGKIRAAMARLEAL